jgi:hypothetical protein
LRGGKSASGEERQQQRCQKSANESTRRHGAFSDA